MNWWLRRSLLTLAILCVSIPIAVWTVSITTGRAADCATSPADDALRFVGEGDEVSDPFGLDEGIIVVLANLPQTGYATVTIASPPGDDRAYAQTVITATREYDGEVIAILPEEGSYVLAVECDCRWTVKIQT